MITKKAAIRLKKRILREYKSILTKTSREIKRFSGDVKEHIKIMDGFENCIMEGILFVKDRDSLITSRICNIHRNHMSSIHTSASSIPKWTSALGSTHSANGALIVQTNTLIKDVVGINKDIKGRINTFIEDIPKFIENINIKLVLINNRIDELEVFYNAVLLEYRNLKTTEIEDLCKIVDDNQ
jgi:hypothetical protein